MNYCFIKITARINLKLCSSSFQNTTTKFFNNRLAMKAATATTMVIRPLSSTTTQSPSAEYLNTSNQTSKILKDNLQRQQLLILDLNGTLLSRTRRRNGMFVRPNIDHFLDFIFNHFKVMVWSSAQKKAVDKMMQLFDKGRMDKLALIWDRSHMGLTIQQYHSDTITVKDLQLVWDSLPGGGYDATNTIMIDDSPDEKSILQPYNTIPIRTFDHTSDHFLLHGDNELLHMIDYLNQLKHQSNVSNFIQSFSYPSLSSSSSTEYHPSSKLCKYYQIDHKKPNAAPIEHDFTVPIEKSKIVVPIGMEKKTKKHKKFKVASEIQNLENPTKKRKKRPKKIKTKIAT
ncbi:HAD-like domain-containing protein [Cunninghamella echinulata]|nr:HAD-like domain-containing protein [Cunninghamella echinulata]